MIRIIAVVFVMWSAGAFAEPYGAQAEALFRQGRDLIDAGKIAEACGAFDESQRLDPAVTTLLNLADCRERQGQLATAWGLFLDAARQTRTASDTTGQQLHASAEAHAQKLEPRVSKLTIRVPRQSQIDDLEILRDGTRINAAQWNRALPIDGGSYTIAARAPGMSEWLTRVTVAAEQDAKTVEIPELHKLPRKVDRPAVPLPSPAVVPPPSPTAVPPRRGPSKVAPVLVGLAAVGLLGGGVAFELRAESKYASAKAEMKDQARRDDLHDAATENRIVAGVFAVAGAAASVTAVFLLFRDGDRAAAPNARVHVAPMAGGFAVVGQF